MINHASNAAFGECTRLPAASITAQGTGQSPMKCKVGLWEDQGRVGGECRWAISEATVLAGKSQTVRNVAHQIQEPN